MVSMQVAQGNGLVDLLQNGSFSTNTTTLGGTDENGPYIWSNDSAGTATTSQAGPTTTFNFNCWGCIFKYNAGANRQYVWGFGAGGNTGFWQNSSTINFVVNNGVLATFTIIPGHTYFAFTNNGRATSGLIRTCTLVDLTTGRVYQAFVAAAVNLIVNPIQGLTISVGVANNRLYAAYAGGSVLVNGFVPAPMFYSVDMIMAGLANPWALWYG